MPPPDLLSPRRPGQRRLLALDGGGIRGILTLAMLARMESDLARRSPDPGGFRLADWFDFIGGTSTGAIVASGLACGMSVADLSRFYVENGHAMFEKEMVLHRLWNLYRGDPLRDQLEAVFGADTTLGSPRLRTLLLAVTYNVTTNSPWLLTNNPAAKYNDRARPDCNLDIPLWTVVRASTAAPTFFPPEVVTLGPRRFVFVDGGMTPYNMPAFAMARIATAPTFGLNWPRGEESLLVVSVGTGGWDRAGRSPDDERASFIDVARQAPGQMMDGMAYDQDLNCRVFGRCRHGPRLDREVGDLVDPAQPGSRAFTYVRYDPDLTPAGLDALGLGGLDANQLTRLDAVDAIPQLQAVGEAFAAREWSLAHFAGFA
ncbi:patatin-like phospholipase family protein [Alsobacter sp. SYSU M60028]|uniref:Patatin-like phospholipase family protein n=1 Tax=Alsobacter ponti TaxID=2962936 RepID=A0ABT1LH41_9HYPH|nr:patatin-like phospholipase family protein [Alsobacter ponti]MCP8940827.1 patatin-like phospholipase family protein [Alsobacter ponti]